MAGTYDLEVRPTGTMTSVLDLMGIELIDQVVYTVIATGFADGMTMPALNAVLVEDAGEARIRVAHMSPDAPAVDIYVNGAIAFDNVAFESVTEYATLPSNSYFIEVTPTGVTDTVVLSATLPLGVGEEFTVVALNTLANIEALVLEDDNTLPEDGKAHVRFVHASPDAPSVDITLPDGTALFSDNEFKEVGDYLPVDAGMYDLEVRLTGTMTTVLNIDDVDLANRTVYTVFATGFADGMTMPALNAVPVADAAPAEQLIYLPIIFIAE